MAQQYKYMCRPCQPRVRRACIEQAHLSPGVKRIIERAFESHTDTQATWDLLHRNCLLEERDEMVIGRDEAEQERGLLGRIQKRAQAEAEPAETEPAWLESEEPIPVVRPQAQVEPGWEPNWEAELRAAEQELAASQQEPPLVVSPSKGPSWEAELRAATEARAASKQEPPPPADWEPNWEAELRAAEQELAAADPFAEITSPDWEPSWGLESITTQQTSEDPRATTFPTSSKPQTPSLLEHLRSVSDERTTAEMEPPKVEPSPEQSAPPTPPPAMPRAVVSVKYPPASRPQQMPISVRGPRMLVAVATGHRILLPEEGELVMGRFDPYTHTTPDIDLSFEDQQDRGVSRRHALIGGWRGQYQLTDLGSSNGTWINDKQLQLHERQSLQVGDEVRLGRCRMYFAQTPVQWREPPAKAQYFFYITFNGQYIPLPDQDVISIGRTDLSLGYQPDVDLSKLGDVSSVVSRNHAKLTRSGNQFSVEDLGSAYKTRVDGQPVHIGLSVPIQPGQHLWLGGCILAFDLVEVD
jgi:pSer/pThr/pTyr-binding forkhead associated (FHA) protein